MDIMISANDEVLRMIREIPVDPDGTVQAEIFKNIIYSIANEKERNDGENEI